MKKIKSVSIGSVSFVFFVLICCPLHNNVSAQINSSPYSRYGIGDLTGKGFEQNFAMGGTNIAMQNDTTAMFFINNGNPASYANIRLTTADLGLSYNSLQLQSSNAKQTINNASFAHLALAFPFKKWWVGSIGLTPFSAVGYKVSNDQVIDNVGDVNFLYQGSGGINAAYFGNSINPLYWLPDHFLRSKRYERLKEAQKFGKASRILKRKRSWDALSLGVNASYLFGGFSDTRSSIFPYGNNAFNGRSDITTRVGDVYFDYGAQYSYSIDSIKGHELKNRIKLLFGATFAAQSNVNARMDSLSYTYFTNSSGYDVPKDTIQNSQNSKGKLQFPLSFGFGLGFKVGDKWLVVADYAVQNWSTYKAFNIPQGLNNSKRISAGIQYVPNSKASEKGSYFKRVNYRIGGRYNQTMVEINNTPLIEQAVSFGLGFPVGRNFLLQNFSMMNIGFELGQRGTINNGLIKERFFNLTFGVTINDRWFVKPKFD